MKSTCLLLLAMVLLNSCDGDDTGVRANTGDGSNDTPESLSAPTFNPAGGSYSSAQTVRLFSATTGATLKYTTDGSVPTSSAQTYIGPFTVASNVTIKAIAVVGNSSSLASSATYMIIGGALGTIPWNSDISYGIMTDDRDGKVYRTVVIGTQTWMAENLNYRSNGSWCYANDSDSCGKYGRFYTWAASMSLPDTCNFGYCTTQALSKPQGICPNGWHLPSDPEWTILERQIGSSNADMELKSRSGWNGSSEGGTSENGTDAYGFRAIPAGFQTLDGGHMYLGAFAFFWNSSEYNSIYAWYRDLHSGDAMYPFGYKLSRYSVRCLKD